MLKRSSWLKKGVYFFRLETRLQRLALPGQHSADLASFFAQLSAQASDLVYLFELLSQSLLQLLLLEAAALLQRLMVLASHFYPNILLYLFGPGHISQVVTFLLCRLHPLLLVLEQPLKEKLFFFLLGLSVLSQKDIPA